MTTAPSDRRHVVVLVVEDEAVQRLALTGVIEEAGFTVVEAWSADEAIRVLEDRTDVRLLVTDIDMPGSMDGLKLAAAVRDRWPPIEIVVVSGGRSPSAADLPERAAFLSKPVHGRTMVETLDRLAG